MSESPGSTPDADMRTGCFLFVRVRLGSGTGAGRASGCRTFARQAAARSPLFRFAARCRPHRSCPRLTCSPEPDHLLTPHGGRVTDPGGGGGGVASDGKDDGKDQQGDDSCEPRSTWLPEFRGLRELDSLLFYYLFYLLITSSRILDADRVMTHERRTNR